ncbi:hypothetical protein LOD99_9528 [Oopsacas minuta]|uniref:Uncharacterized protein n=1 Tax=Oopsacas minuta TaxID=111878 RepID=A0AAV7JBF5_9METZ|nr:hypothetical protein LOD99_9528 [Oopsacas minuta]
MSVLITNNEAYSLYISNGRSVTVSVRKLIENNHLSDEETATLQFKFKSLLTSREAYRRKDLETWLFEEVDEEDYLKLPSNQHVGITHQPTSNIAIIAASPLDAYLCVLSWFMLLISHLDAGHKLIGAYNNGKGLQNLSEECLESCNKFVRRYRENLARKTSFTDNVRDILVRLLCCSDPILVQNRLKHAKKKRDVANSLQEILYNSILSDDL